jgi:hypothetical protein
MTNQMWQDLSWVRNQIVSNHLTTDNCEAGGREMSEDIPMVFEHFELIDPG